MTDFQALYDKAHAAGMAAGRAACPMPMTVYTADPLTGRPDGRKSWYVPEGACGFAWVKLRPARGAFYTWCKAKGIGHKDYNGGWSIWCGEFNQSVDRKAAYANAFAKVLTEAGINAYGESRLD